MRSFAERAVLALLIFSLPAGIAALYLTFIVAPEERVMGAAQKIFYFHLPAAFVTYAGVALLLVGSIGYLWRRDSRFDHVGRASCEQALLFCSICLVSGMIWGRSAWGTWWTWEPRLTSTLILWLLLLGCLLVRRYATEPELGARLAAIMGIVAALDIPIIHKAVEWWRGVHPEVFEPNKESSIETEMAWALAAATLVSFALFALLTTVRAQLLALEERTDRGAALLEKS